MALLFTILIARLLGPEGKGIYTLAIILPTTIVMIVNLGIGPATIYYVAQNKYSKKVILGNNIIVAIIFSSFGLIISFIIISLFRTNLFPGVKPFYLHLALLLIIGNICFNYFQGLLLGKLLIVKYNLITVIQSFILIISSVFLLYFSKIGITGAIVANILTVFVGVILILIAAYRISEGISLRLNKDYLKKIFIYGYKAHIGNIISFLIYKIDFFLIGILINPIAVGLYSVSSGLAERLWMISQTASFVLFPRIAAEEDDKKKNTFTPIIARNVFLLSLISGILLIILSKWIVTFLYSNQYSDSIKSLQILIPGIVALGVGRVLANDISGRGKPEISIYSGLTALIANILLNIILIPKWGINGAAIASTISYILSFLISLIFYIHITKNSWYLSIIPQKSDWYLYQNYINQIANFIKNRIYSL